MILTAPRITPPEAIGTATYIRSVLSVFEWRIPVAMRPCRAEANSGRVANERRPGKGGFVSSSERPFASTMTTRPPGERW